MEDHLGRIWISSIREGIFLFDKKTATISRFQTPPSANGGLSLKNVTKLFRDSKGRMWIGCGGGRFEQGQALSISCVDFGMDTIYHYTLHPKIDDIRRYINGIEEDGSGNIWINAFQTLFRLDPSSGQIRQFNHQHTRFSIRFFRHGQRQSGKLVDLGDDGFTCFDPINERVLAFKPGRLSHNFIGFKLAGFCNKNGELFFGDNNGFHAFFPKKAIQEIMRFSPKVRLTEFLLAGSRLKALPGSPLTKSIWETSEIKLAHHQNVFSIRFSTMDFRSPLTTRYLYILENYDAEWRWASANPMAGYSRVPPGKYRFRVKALTNGSFWSEEVSLHISISPPLWANIWAYSFYVVICSALIYFIVNLQFKRRLAQAETKALRRLDHAKNHLYTNISHEFRTPITVIMGMARQVKDNPEKWFRHGLEMIIENSQKLLRLVNNMLNLSKVEAGVMEVQMQQGNIISYLYQVVEPFLWYAKSKNIQLDFHPKENEILMDYDAEKLTHICANLLSNAIKFTPEGGRVDVEASTCEIAGQKCLSLQVTDTGIGISKEHVPHIFDRFFSQPLPTVQKAGLYGPDQEASTGIGLALTRELVKLLGGQIEVESQEGQGSTFAVTLPIHRTSPLFTDHPHQDWNDTSGPSNGETLPIALIVEDNPHVVIYLISFLSDKYQIVTAKNGTQGINQAIEHIPDIIISDVMMPEKDGFELCETIKQDSRTCHIPIILLTARTDQTSRLSGLQKGADAYLAKPFNQDEMLITMEQLIKGRRQLQQYYLAAAGLSAESHTTKDPLELPVADHTFVKNVYDIVLAHLDDYNFQVQDITNKIHLSHSQLHRKLRALTGMSTNNFIRSIRLQKARAMLKDQDRSITSIALDTGFQHPDYFSKVFHDEFGMTPTAFREKHFDNIT
ncbi:MAG: response regulator [Saprospiraceae bacterium]|nr:response regulator [Saprospiraceae bacterium]